MQLNVFHMQVCCCVPLGALKPSIQTVTADACIHARMYKSESVFDQSFNPEAPPSTHPPPTSQLWGFPFRSHQAERLLCLSHPDSDVFILEF